MFKQINKSAEFTKVQFDLYNQLPSITRAGIIADTVRETVNALCKVVAPERKAVAAEFSKTIAAVVVVFRDCREARDSEALNIVRNCQNIIHNLIRIS